MIPNQDRWIREVTIPLVAEEIAALCGSPDEARDADGRWSKSGAPGSQHGSKKNMIRQNAESHAAYANKVLHQEASGSLPGEVIRAAQKIANHKGGWIEGLTPHEASAWHAHVEGRINHEGAITDHSDATPLPKDPGVKIRPYKDRNKPWPKHAAEEIEALFNTVGAAASFAPGLRGGTDDAQAKMDGSQGTEDEVLSMDSAGEKRDTSGKWTAEQHLRQHKSHKELAKIAKRDGMEMQELNHQRRAAHHLSEWKKLKGIKHAAGEIQALLMAGHDVSGEGRQHGKFAPGGANKASPATTPTGSPLDPATGQAEPPKQSAIHKERYDAHTAAAKTYHDLVKQHLNLAKIALDPQDRQRHIDQARQHKQAADQHIQQAEQHALAHSKAVTTEAQMAGQGAGGMMAPNAGNPGLNIGKPGGATSIRGAMVQTPSKPQPWVGGNYGGEVPGAPNSKPAVGSAPAPQGDQGWDQAHSAAIAKKAAPGGPIAPHADPNNQTQKMKPVGPASADYPTSMPPGGWPVPTDDQRAKMFPPADPQAAARQRNHPRSRS